MVRSLLGADAVDCHPRVLWNWTDLNNRPSCIMDPGGYLWTLRKFAEQINSLKVWFAVGIRS